MDLENLFNTEKTKKDIQHEKYVNGLKEQWETALAGANIIYDKISFLNNKGYKVEKANCTPFDYSDASNGYYPNVRVNGTTMVQKYNLEDEFIKVSGFGKFQLMGEKHTFETFIQKLIR